MREPRARGPVARHAEDAGFESVWTGEHLVLPDPQPESFSMPPTLLFLDTIVALTLVAAETRTLKVASGNIELLVLLPNDPRMGRGGDGRDQV